MQLWLIKGFVPFTTRRGSAFENKKTSAHENKENAVEGLREASDNSLEGGRHIHIP